MQQRPSPTAVVIGTEDHHFDPMRLAALEMQENVTVITVEGGNHGLNAGETAGDSARALADVIGQLDAFYDFPRHETSELD